MISHAELKKLLSYDPLTGQFVWLVTVGKARQGNIAGQIRKDGYALIGIGRRQFLSHRLAWFYLYGKWPGKCLDHIDCDRSNNKIANLRDTNKSVNALNTSDLRLNNSSGFTGVSWNPQRKKWVAQIHLNGKKKHIGLFDRPDDAHFAYTKEREVAIAKQCEVVSC